MVDGGESVRKTHVILGTVEREIAAAGSTQATAKQLTADHSEVTTISSGQGVILPAMTFGDIVSVGNAHASQALLVYPVVGGKFQNKAINTPVSLPAGRAGIFRALSDLDCLFVGGPVAGDSIVVGNIVADDIDANAINAQDGAFADTLTLNGVSVATVNQEIGIWSGTFKFPESETVDLILSAEFPFTITRSVTRTKVGTATVQVLNNGSGLNANSASTSQDSIAQNSAVADGSYVGATFSSVSSDCENLCLTIWGTRVLAS